jgi:large subunit ribosomal protein L2
MKVIAKKHYSTQVFLHFFKGTRPSARHKVVTLASMFLNNSFCRRLIFGKKEFAGRNNTGTLTSYHRGGGVKKKTRIIDFYGRVFFLGIVLAVEYDSKRSSFLSLICNWKGFVSYRIAANNLKRGHFIGFACSDDLTFYNGFFCILKNISLGSRIFNVETFKGSGGRIARSAGTFCKLSKKLFRYGILMYPSGKLQAVGLNFFCTLGRVSNVYFKTTQLGTAGSNRRLGSRPTVRGVAMNPVDHPHGGRTAGGRNPVSPWGHLTKHGYKRKKKKKNSFLSLLFLKESDISKV